MTAPAAAATSAALGGTAQAATTTAGATGVTSAAGLIGQVEILRHFLADVSTVLASDLTNLWRHYDGSPDFPSAIHAAVPDVIDLHAQAAAAVTAQWYDELDLRSTFRAEPIVDIPPEQISKTIDWALYAPGGAEPLDRVIGSSDRMVLNASRQTVVDNADREGVAYARLAQANACGFCKTLSTRGAVYSTERTALQTKAGHSYHDHCACVATPVRTGQVYHPPDYAQFWDQEYRDAVKGLKEDGKPVTLGAIANRIDVNAAAKVA